MAYTQKAESTLRDVKDAARDAKDAAVETMGDAATRVSDAVDSMTREAGNIRNAVQRSASDLASDITRKLRAAGVDTDQLIITAKEQASDVQQKLMDEVRERPLRALGVAALVGIAVGLLTSRS